MYNLISNDRVSTSALYLEHGLFNRIHKYIRREGTPGNYKYIYKENVQLRNRNDSGATLFGDKSKRKFASQTRKQLSRYQSILNRTDRSINRKTNQYLRSQAASIDPTKSKLYRQINQKKADRLQKSIGELARDRAQIQRTVDNGRQLYERAMSEYNRSRKIDDVQDNVAQAGKNLINRLRIIKINLIN